MAIDAVTGLEIFVVEIPTADERTIITIEDGTIPDLSAFANTPVKIYSQDNALWVVTDSGAIVVIENFFILDDDNNLIPRSIIFDDNSISGTEFMSAFSVTDLPNSFAEGDTDENQTTFDSLSTFQAPTGFAPLSSGSTFSELINLFNEPSFAPTALDQGNTEDDATTSNDVPTIGTPEDGLVTEASLEVSIPQSITGDLSINFGEESDNSSPDGGTSTGTGDRSATFAPDTISTLNALGLVSEGQALSYSINGQNDLVTATSADGRAIFTLELFDTDTGSYEFTLFDNLDHPDATSADIISLSLDFVATDSNADSVTSTLNISIEDAIPSANVVNSNTVENVDIDITLVAGTDFSYGLDTFGASIALGVSTISTSSAGNALNVPSISLLNDGVTVQVTMGTTLDLLAIGETATISVPYTVTDGDNDTALNVVELLVTGTNDAPEITIIDVVGDITEAATLSDAGSISFTDVDLTDRATAAEATKTVLATKADGVTPLVLSATQQADIEAAFTLPAPQGNTNNGTIGWDYTITEAKLDFLAKDETVTATFTITLDDQNGGADAQDVIVTLKGTNDVPVISIVDVTGDITEGVTLTDAGSVTFADVDLTDLPTATEATNKVSATQADGTTELVLTAPQLADIEAAFTLPAPQGNTHEGTIGWDYTITEAKLDFLAKGETVTAVFTITVDDQNGGTDTQDVAVTIEGTNDAPVLTGVNVAGDITEGTTLNDTGSITFTDVDLTDLPTATEAVKTITATKIGGVTELVLSNAQKADLEAAFTLPTPQGNTNNGTIGWDYTILEAKLDFLAKGETVTAVFTVTIDDQNGGIDTQDITLTINGTNDVPIISVVDVVGEIIEGTILTDAGSITFADIDLTDLPTASETTKTITATQADGATALTLTAGQKADLEAAFTLPAPQGNTNDGTIGWDYTISKAKLDFLARGETVTAVFTIKVDDLNGGTDTQDVTVTLIGNNDDPVITGGVVDGDITEGTTLSDNGSITFTDLDFTDLPTATEAVKTITATKIGGGTELVLSSAQKADLETAFTLPTPQGNTNNGTIGWDYTVLEAKLDFLAKGETVTAVFTVTIDDQNGGTDTQDITVLINGTNDAPIITAVDVAGEITEGTTLTDNGSITFTDVDLTDLPKAAEITKSVTATKAGGQVALTLSDDQKADLEAAFTLSTPQANSNDGTIGWDYTVTEAKLDFLAKGETVTAVFTVTVDDLNGGVKTQDVTVTINGTTDAPLITVVNVAGEITEGTTLTDNGSITFNDVDLTDLPTASELTSSVTATKSDASTLTLTNAQKADLEAAFSLSTPSGNTNSGTIEWDYTITDAKLDFLAKGETVTAVFTIKVDDQNGGTADQNVTVTINGTNDVPVLTAVSVQGDIALGTSLTALGSVTFTDLDLTDLPTATEAVKTITATKTGGISELTLSDDQKSDFEAAFTLSAAQGNANNGTIGWDYTIDNSKLSFLATGETVTAVFTITIDDMNGGTDTQDVTLKIAGTNDDPVITGGVVAGEIAEGATLTDNGTITFTDLDLTDLPTATETTKTVTALQADGTTAIVLTAAQQAEFGAGFSIAPSQTNANDGTIEWGYTIDDAKLNFLAKDEVINAVFTVTINDQNGGTDTQDVAITIKGTNDLPVISIGDDDSAGKTLTETNVALSATGTLSVDDVDLTDTVDINVAAIDKLGNFNGLTDTEIQNLLTITKGPIDATPGDVNNVTWTFNATATMFDHLALGEAALVNYKIWVTDSSNGITEQIVSIIVNGTNDAPVISIETGDSASLSINETSQSLILSDTLSVSDLDLTNNVTASVVSVASSQTTNGLLSDNDALKAMMSLTTGLIGANNGDTNNLTWTFNSDTEAFNYLNTGENLVLTYTVRVTDTHNATDDETITIRINGTNIAPEITAVKVVSDITEGSSLSDNGSITFTDLDTFDRPTASETGNIAATKADGSQLILSAAHVADIENAFTLSVPTGVNSNTNDGTVNWTYSIDETELDFLSKGETVTATFTITVDDQKGETDTQDVTIIINGTNDIPDVTVTGFENRQAMSAGSTATIASSAALRSDNWTIEAWVQTDNSSASYNRVITAPAGGGQSYSLVVNNGKAHVRFDNGTGRQIENVHVADGQWHHLAATFDSVSNELSLFVDGQNAGTLDVGTNAPIASVEDIQIGRHSSSYPAAFPGSISDVRIWSSVRSADEIADGYLTKIDPATNPTLELYLPLDGSGIDVTGKNLDANFASGSAFSDADIPVQFANIIEGSGALNNSGTISFTDLDLTDRPVITETTAEFTALKADGTVLVLSAIQQTAFEDALTLTPVAGNQNNGSVTVDYTLSETALDFLAADETINIVYTITVNDQNGGIVTQDVIVDIKGTNDVPVFSSITVPQSSQFVDGLSNTIAITEGDSAVDLTLGVQVSDIEMSALNNGLGDFKGSELTLSRDGGANSNDIITITNGTNFVVGNGVLQSNGATFATYSTAIDGQLSIQFTSIGTTATSSLVNEVMSGLQYTNSSDAPAANIDIIWSFVDGLGEAHALTATGKTTVTVTAVNDDPTVLDGTLIATEDAGIVTLNLTTLGSDVDADDDGSTLTYRVKTGGDPAEGSASISGTILTFDPGANFQRLNTGEKETVTVEIEAVDQHGAVSNTASVAVTINGEDDDPIANHDTYRGKIDVLLVTADIIGGSTDRVETTQAALSDLDVFNSVVVHDVRAGTSLTYQDFAGYEVVLTWSADSITNKYGDATAVGDLLAQYVAGGGGVVVGANALLTGGIGGAIVNQLPLGIPVGGSISNTQGDGLQPTVAGASIFGSTDVITFPNQVFFTSNGATLASGATLLATSLNGDNNLIARNAIGNVISINIFSGSISHIPALVKIFGDLLLDVAAPGVTAVTAAPYAISQAELLANDTDPNGDALSILSISAQSTLGATLTLNNDGTISYDVTTSQALIALSDTQELTDFFTYVVTDTDGNTNSATVTMAVGGVNEAPVMSNEINTIALEESVSSLVHTGTFTVSDVDTSNVVTASVDGLVITGTSNRSDQSAPSDAELEAMMSIRPAALIGTTATSGTLTWDFNAGSETFDYLTDGEKLILTYTIKATDDGANPLSDSNTIEITVTGTNDAPVITGLTDGYVIENDVSSVLIDSFALDDLDTASGLTFRVLDGSNAVDSRFEVVVASGTTDGDAGTYELRLKSGQSLNHETDPTIALKVEVNDLNLVNNLTTVPVTVTVNDVAEAPSVSIAVIQPEYHEFQVNTTTASFQRYGSVAKLDDGSVVMVWQSNRQISTAAGNEIVGQRFSAEGAKLGGEFVINTETAGGQINPALKALDGGGFVVAWQHNTGPGKYSIAAQRYNTDGTTDGSELTVVTGGSGIEVPDLQALPGGGFVTFWKDSNNGVKGQLVGDDGVNSGPPFQVSESAAREFVYSTTTLPSNKFVVIWSDANDGDSWGILGRIYNTDGTPVAGQFQINTTTAGFQGYADVSVFADGGFVVTWQSGGDQDGSGNGVYAQRYDAGGSQVGTEFLVNTQTADNQDNPSVVTFANGEFLIAWTSNGQDGSGYGVYGQRFKADGSAKGDEFQLNETTAGNQQFYNFIGSDQMVVLDDGNVLAVWGSTGTAPEIFARIIADPDVVATEDQPFSISIDVAPNAADTEASITGVVLSGLPTGFVIVDTTDPLNTATSTGMAISIDVTGWDLASLSVTPAADWNGDLTLSVSATSTVGATTAMTAKTLDITINPLNDAATFTVNGAVKDSVTEDLAVDIDAAGNLVASGDLDVNDVDGTAEEMFLITVTFKEASHSDSAARGAFTINADGEWQYTIANNNADVQDLDDGDNFTETFTVKSQDGTTEDITITVNGYGNSADPIILDLDNDGVETLAASAGITFDIDADGNADQIGWVGADDGLLVVDLDGSGSIEDGSEVFSEVFNGGSYADSLEALRTLDINSDGVLDANDAGFENVLVWQDANSDGVSDAGEFKTLSEHSITSLDLDALEVDRSVNGNTVFADGTFIKEDGSTGGYVGVNFAQQSISEPLNIDPIENTTLENIFEAGSLLAPHIGTDGRDTFVINDNFLVDEIIDFAAIDDTGDLLDISSLLEAANYNGDTLSAEIVGQDTIVRLDLDGAGSGDAVDIATLKGVTAGNINFIEDDMNNVVYSLTI